MIARLAYLTSPKPGVFMLNFQLEDEITSIQFEISRAHLANIIIDGASFSLRETCSNRVPAASQGIAETV